MKILISNVTCPNCGHKADNKMPENHCLLFYTCSNCQSILKPQNGDCCIFCSYGDVKCPPMQEGT
ncbi:MAG: GDCCVxC domain-containing (seleno)protein [Candidatus Hodarchaeales archaeon]